MRVEGKGLPIETTADRIKYARHEQLAARQAGNTKLEKTWSEALDRLLTTFIEEMEVHANT